jgi:hypothetical protein
MLPLLPDELLLDAYRSALRLQLDRDFVHMLRSEIRHRKLSVPEEPHFGQESARCVNALQTGQIKKGSLLRYRFIPVYPR